MNHPTQYQQQETYDPSQVQPYDQSAQAYYAFHQYNQYVQHQQYPYNYTQDYPNPYHREPTSIHPPGVPIQPESTPSVDPQQTYLQNQQISCYLHEISANQQLSSLNSSAVMNPAAVASVAARSQVAEFTGEKAMRQQWQSGLTPHMRGGRRGGRPFRDGNLGHFGARPDGPGPSFHGKGRGRGYGRQFSAPGDKTAVSVRGESSQNKVYPQNTPGWAPPRMAWCELCRVDCNTPEILEQHKNGKKHKKNLQVYEELQKLNKVLTGGQNGQVSVPEVKQEVSQQEKVEGSENKPPEENTSSQTVIDKNEVEERELTEVLGQGHGSKRKMRGGRGVKWMRTQEGSRRPVEPHKPKQVVPFFCELCNVRCDSQVVFQTHLNGKKHLGNLKRFQDQQMMLGQVALQALYPALQALYPALQALYNPNPDASTSFAPQFNQASQGPLPQPMPSVLPPSQVPVLTSTMEEQENKDPGPEQTEATSEAASKDAAVAEAKPQKQPASEELNAQPGVEPLLDTAAGAEQVLSSGGAGQTSEDAS